MADTDLRDVQLQVDKKTNESLESTRRMMQLCEESRDVGVKTLVMLDEQGEQLDRVEQTTDEINAKMREAEKNLEGLEKCCGLCVCPWNRASNFEKSKEFKGAYNQKDNSSKSTITQQPNHAFSDGSGSSGGFIQKITNDAREDEMDENLAQVSSMLGNLKNMAIDMGSVVETQNKQIERIHTKVETTDSRIKTANVRATNILRNS